MTAARKRFATPVVCSIVVIALAGALRLWDPFYGDQALFLTAASTLHHGGALYRDFWDIKQPGIFAFFWAGATAFGFTQVGEHVAELVWQLVFAIALAAGLRGAYADGRWSALVPLVVVGSYFAASPLTYLTQVEGLVGLPVFACAWCARHAIDRAGARAFVAALSGMAAGLVVVFKLVLVVIPVAVTVAMLLAARPSLARGTLVRFALAWASGSALPLVLCLAYARVHGTTAEFLATTFVVPLQISKAFGHAPIARLAGSAKEFVTAFAALVVAAAIGGAS